MGSAALAFIWAGTERGGGGTLPSDSIRKTGNGHPAAPTILVVEDEILIRMSVCDYLRDCGYRVLEASNAAEAQTVFAAGEPIEILFSDIDLGPGKNGFELARWVRATYPSVRIVLTSGIARMAQDAADLCDGPLLQKPYSYASLVDQIKRLVALLGRQSG